ncbi:SPFH domain-containing protein [Nocardia yamanashiensis]|uniref:SPFH domain-containing protein n=1 Tax=Nocardia yamanashiensis TaxID=209247 RepID=UPI000830A89E|nr:SPFH domain-containing protein [Nocardia yamanashiensis]
MAWFEREFIAVPEEHKNQLVYKWPDRNIRRYSRAIVDADQTALFMKSGRVIANLGPGRHRIDADELPVLGALVDTLTGGNHYRAELYFVSTREFPGNKFGGRLTDITDPVSEQVLSLRAFGEFGLAVRDPAALITGFNGTADPADRGVTPAWCAELLLKSMKICVTQGISRGTWPVIGLPGVLPAIESAVLRHANTALYEYGLRIPRLGNFDITLAPEDADRLKRLAKDSTYIRMTGDFQRYALGELALGAGQGMTRGSDGSGLLGAAFGLNALQQHPWSAPAAPPPDSGTRCPDCGAANPGVARFCMSCGAGLAAGRTAHCTRCAAELPADARFCGNCGTPVP